MPASIAILITAGTKIPDTLSAILAIGALEFCASSTSLIIFDSLVSSPTLSAVNLSIPPPLIVPPKTLSPTPLSTGILSPVNMLSLTLLSPSDITPSQQKLSPAFTRTTSPCLTSLLSTCTHSSPRSTVAYAGVSIVRARIASPVFLRDLLSKNLPSDIIAMITATLSK